MPIPTSISTPLAIAGLFASVFGALMLWEHLQIMESGRPPRPRRPSESESHTFVDTFFSHTHPHPHTQGQLETVAQAGAQSASKVETATTQDRRKEDVRTAEMVIRLQSDISLLKKTIRELEGQLRSARGRCGTLESEKERARERMKERERERGEQLGKMRVEKESLRGLLGEKESEMEKLRAEVGRLKAALRVRLDENGRTVSQLSSELASSQALLQQQTALALSLRELFEKAVEENAKKGELVVRLEKELEDMRRDVGIYEKKLEEVEAMWKRAQGGLALEEEVARVKKELKERDEELRWVLCKLEEVKGAGAPLSQLLEGTGLLGKALSFRQRPSLKRKKIPGFVQQVVMTLGTVTK